MGGETPQTPIQTLGMVPVIRRLVWFFALLCVLLFAGGVGIAGAESDAEKRAGLVIHFGDGSTQTRCVSFTEQSITGEQVLQRSGLSVTLNYNLGFGGAVCSINNQGCVFPAPDCECFCQCRGASCEYWAYFHLTPAGWEYSSVGASSYLVTDGAVEGWSWGAR